MSLSSKGEFMDKYCNMKFKIPENLFNEIQEILKTLKQRGWQKKDFLGIQDVLFLELLKGLTPGFKKEFIEKHTPVDFLIAEALKDPAIRTKVGQFLKTKKITLEGISTSEAK